MKLYDLSSDYIVKIVSEKSSDHLDFQNPDGQIVRGFWLGVFADYRYYSDGTKSGYLGDTLAYSSRFEYGSWDNSYQFKSYLWKLITNGEIKEDLKFEWSLLKDIARAEFENEAILVSNRKIEVSVMMTEIISKAVNYMIKNSIGISDLIQF